MDPNADHDARRSLKERMAEVEGSYETIRDMLAEMQQRMAELTSTARSRDDLVRATVDARGRLTALKVAPEAMDDLGNTELASMIVSTARQAAKQVTEDVAELLERYSPTGSSAAAAIRSGNYDLVLRRSAEASAEPSTQPPGRGNG